VDEDSKCGPGQGEQEMESVEEGVEGNSACCASKFFGGASRIMKF
jgi:hypothetical protein